MKSSDARELVALVQAAFPRQPWPAETVALFSDELARLPDREHATRAIRSMIRERTSEWAPSIAEILRAVVDEMDESPSFSSAWAEMEAKASDGDYFKPNVPPAFSHPAITRLAALIGWQNFTDSSEGDTYFRHTAERIYADVVEHRHALALDAPEMARELLSGNEPDVDPVFRELIAGISDDD